MRRLNGRRVRTAAAGAWLTGLAVCTVAGTEGRFWPVAPAGMFAFQANETELLSLRGTTAEDTEVELAPSAFGLDPVEFSAQLIARSGGQVGFDDRAVIAAIAQEWVARHHVTLRRVTLVAHRTLLDRHGRRVDAEVLSVELPAAGTGAP